MYHKILKPLIRLCFLRSVFYAVPLLVIVFHLDNDQTMTRYYARRRPNFTGRASARASQARAWAVSKVWAYIFSVVLVWLWPRAAETLRTSSPL